MKKLLIAAALLCAGVAMGDVESSNIVGYAKNGMTDGFKMVTPQFVGIGEAGMDIQTIKGEGDDLYDFSLQILKITQGFCL